MRILRRPARDQVPNLRPISAWVWMLLAVAMVGVTITVTTTWLLAVANDAKAGTDRTSARLDAVRTGLGAGAGAGAAIGLMLAFRRQHHQEIATALSDHDASERRITELYTKAADQLGNEHAAVRLAGLYAFERIAQGHPGHRQTIVDVICAYLRMPYTPPSDTDANEPQLPEVAAEQARRHEELQVRLTAQRILGAHLRDNRPSGQQDSIDTRFRFWGGIRLDLTAAALIDLDLFGCQLEHATFTQAVFHGYARFNRVTFCDYSRFEGAIFHGYADFEKAVFDGTAGFERVVFHGTAGFNKIFFHGTARFEGSPFHGTARFNETTFQHYARFEGVTFHNAARFSEASFEGSTRLDRARVQRLSSQHVWPPGWGVRPNSNGTGTLTRVTTEEPPLS